MSWVNNAFTRVNLILKEEPVDMDKLKARKMATEHTKARFITILQRDFLVRFRFNISYLSRLVIKFASCSRIEGEMREGHWYGKRT